MHKYALAAVLLAGAAALPSVADAALYTLSGTATNVGVGTAMNQNQVLDKIGGFSNPTGGIVGRIQTNAANLNVTYTFLGSESGYANTQFVTGSGSYTETNGAYSGDATLSNILVGTQTVAGSGSYLDFRFTSSASDSWNNLTGAATANVGVWFRAIGDTAVYFGFNDSGADVDYDDWFGRIDFAPVPIPGAVLLFGSALAGLGFMRRRMGGSTAWLAD